MDRLGSKIEMARKKAKMSETALAEKIGVSRRSVYAYENGASVPRKT